MRRRRDARGVKYNSRVLGGGGSFVNLGVIMFGWMMVAWMDGCMDIVLMRVLDSWLFILMCATSTHRKIA